MKSSTHQNTELNTSKSYLIKVIPEMRRFSKFDIYVMQLMLFSVRPLPPTINGKVGSKEETKPLDVTCKTTGSRPRATLQWTIRVITKLPNSEQSNKGKVKTHKYINRQNQSTTGKL